MTRQIIKIDKDKCNGCEACVKACHEGAIAMVGDKAELIRDDYCDGLGNCLPTCPTGAITFEERDAAAYDEVAVKKNMADKESVAKTEDEKGAQHSAKKLPCGCPSNAAMTFDRETDSGKQNTVNISASYGSQKSELKQFPIQIKLVNSTAPYFNGCDLLIAANCTAFAYGDFHKELIKGKITIIGCPKLDEGDYANKLTEIIASNDIESITVVRMEVPCCGGIVQAVKAALRNSGKIIPWQIVTITRDGKIIK